MLKKWILLFLQCKIEILQFFSAKKKRGSRSLSWCGECLIPERTADGMVSTASCIRNVSVLEHSWTVQCSITCSPLNPEGNRLKVVFLHLRKVSHTTQIFSCASFCLSLLDESFIPWQKEHSSLSSTSCTHKFTKLLLCTTCITISCSFLYPPKHIE